MPPPLPICCLSVPFCFPAPCAILQLRRAKVTATTAVHQHRHHQHHHGDGVVTTQPGRQVKNPAYNTSELPAGTPLDADGDVAYSHIYDEARFGFNSFA